MQTLKKEFDLEKMRGFATTNLMYDKQENALYRYSVYNNDFTNKKHVPLSKPAFESVSEEVFKINLQDFPFKVEDDKVIIDYSGDIVKEFKSVSWQLSYSQPYGSDELDFVVKKISLHIEFAEKPE